MDLPPQHPSPSEEATAPVASAPTQSLDWAELVERVDQGGQLRVAQMMRDRVRVIEITDGRLIFEQADNYSDDPIPDIRDALFKLTGKRWQVERGAGDAQPSLRETQEAEAKATKDSHPRPSAGTSNS